MALISTLENCCSIFELGEFYTNDTKENILETIKDSLEDYIDSSGTLEEYPTVIIATTRKDTQPRTEKILKELGFRSRSINSRHKDQPKGNLSLWIRTSLPKEIKSWLTKEIKTRKKEYKGYTDDQW